MRSGGCSSTPELEMDLGVGHVEYRVEQHAAKLGGRHRSSVVELSIRNPARPAHASAGRCVCDGFGDAHAGRRRLATPLLAPILAARSRSIPAREASGDLRSVGTVQADTAALLNAAR